jgi:hypothetical protein
MNKPHPVTSKTGWNEQGEPVLRNNRSEAAAKAAQYVNDLEIQIEEQRVALSNLRGLLEAQEETNKKLSAEIVKLQSDRDYFHDRWITVWTTLNNSAKLLLDCMRDKPPEEAKAVEPPPNVLIKRENE